MPDTWQFHIEDVTYGNNFGPNNTLAEPYLWVAEWQSGPKGPVWYEGWIDNPDYLTLGDLFYRIEQGISPTDTVAGAHDWAIEWLENNVGGTLGSLAKSVLDAVFAPLFGLAAFASVFFTPGALVDAMEAAAYGIVGAVGMVGGTIMEFGNAIGSAVEGVWDGVQSAWSGAGDMWGDVSSFVGSAWGSATSWVSDAWSSASSAIGGAWNTVTSWASGAWNAVTDWVGGFFNGGAEDYDESSSYPIVFDLDGDGLELSHRNQNGVVFDFNGDGEGDNAGWVDPDDGILVFDADNSGDVSGAEEIAFTHWLEGAATDLAGLAFFDVNGDGVLNAQDAAEGDFDWSQFMVWRDLNQNGVSDPGELQQLSAYGIVGIGLGLNGDKYHVEGNTVHNTTTYTMEDGSTGLAGDVSLKVTPSGAALQAKQDAIVRGTAESDALDGGSADDVIFGEGGDDVLRGKSGDDWISGGAGDDNLQGGSGADTLMGVAGADVLEGGSGNDILYGGNDDDTLEGGSGEDELYGDAGNDWLDGGSGEDILDGGLGNDILVGASGDDRFMFSFKGGHDVIDDFDVGRDILDLSDSSFVDNGVSFDDLDSDDDGELTDADDAISLVDGDLLIDFSSFGEEGGSVTLRNVHSLQLADMAF